MNTGADYSLTQRLILTGRFGYYFENYHDFGLPTTGTLTQWDTNGVGAHDALGAPLASFAASRRTDSSIWRTAKTSPATTPARRTQADVNLAWFKSGWRGTHNFKFGYQLNHLNNNIDQHYNVPLVQYFVGPRLVVHAIWSRGHGKLRTVRRAVRLVHRSVRIHQRSRLRIGRAGDEQQ